MMSSNGSAILIEGVDILNIDWVIVVRPTRSRKVIVQMVCSPLLSEPAPIDFVRRLDTGCDTPMKRDCQMMDFVDIAG